MWLAPQGQRGWNPRQQNLPPIKQSQGPESFGQIRAQPAIHTPDFQQHLNAQRDAQMGMQDRMPKINYGPSPFGQSIRQENPYRPSPPRRGPGGLGGGGFGGGSQGIDQFMDFMRQMMDMFKQFNSQGGGGGYGQGRGPGGFPQPPQQYGQFGQMQPQPSRLRTQGPESIGMPQLRPHQTMNIGNPTSIPMWRHGGPGEATLQTAQLTSPR